VAYWNQSDKGFSLIIAGPEGKTEGKAYDMPPPEMLFSVQNSTRIAYCARTGDRMVAVIDGLEGKQYDEIFSIVFSPDSNRLAYLAKSGNKTAVVVDGEEKLYDDASGLTFSPDSKHLAYTSPEAANHLLLWTERNLRLQVPDWSSALTATMGIQQHK
jgi:WD40 repeat protein